MGIHDLPPEDTLVDTVFIRRRNGFTSSALLAFLACAAGD
jgi:LysR family transcriptional regulator, cell division regulator